MISDMVRLVRFRHWIKNVVVLMPVVFSSQMNDAEAWFRAGGAAIAFCFASAFSYIVNDIRDKESDRNHPLKKDRPIASGSVGVGPAIVEAVVFFLAATLIAGSISTLLLLVVSVYIMLQILYSLFLKHAALIDVICIAFGFVLRAVAGAVAIRVEISPWLFICIFTLCLFMGFCKRCNELVTIGDAARAGEHRPTLLEYTPQLLTHLITLSAGIAVVAFLLYGLSDRTISRFGTDYFVYTLPIMVYGIFRFAMLSMKGAYADPTDLILRDRPFQVTIVVWMAAAIMIIRCGKELASWISDMYCR